MSKITQPWTLQHRPFELALPASRARVLSTLALLSSRRIGVKYIGRGEVTSEITQPFLRKWVPHRQAVTEPGRFAVPLHHLRAVS